MKNVLPCLLAIAAPIGAAFGAETELTVYNQGPAFVRESRSLELEDGWGRFELEFGRWLPETVEIEAARGPVSETRVLSERSPDAMGSLAFYRGREVVLHAEGRSVYGTLEAVGSQGAVIRTGDGLAWIPEDLWQAWELPAFEEAGYRRPMVRFRAGAGREGRFTCSYFVEGLAWEAEYRALLPRDEGSMHWDSRIRIANGSGRAYDDASLQLVAGEPARAHTAPRPPGIYGAGAERALMKADVPPSLPESEPLGEMHLFRLAETMDLEEGEMRKVALYPPSGVTFRREFRYLGQQDGRRVRTYVLFRNDETSGLGMPLPAGRVQFLETDREGKIRPLGEAHLASLAANEDAELLQGFAFDVSGERTIVETDRISRTAYRQRVRIELSNRKAEAVRIRVEERLHGSWKILEESHEGNRESADLLVYEVSVPPDETVTLEYEAEFQ
jgi:hypothetical protein